jgi:thiamine-monophosphate kinase
MLLSELGEFGLIDRIRNLVSPPGDDVIRGIGEDCAVTRLTDGTVQVVTTDTLVEGLDFVVRPGFSFASLGHKALAVNLSDIAAMGAIPRHALVSLCIPDRYTTSDISLFYNGLSRIAESHSITVVGGDLSASPHDLIVSITLLGTAGDGEVVFRDGAHPGDAIMLFGRVGDSGAGLDILRGEACSAAALLISRHLEPHALVREMRWLATHERASLHAMIDVSDGIASDIQHICHASGTGALLDAARLPISRELSVFLHETGKLSEHYLLRAGEDYSMLACVDSKTAEQLSAHFEVAFPEIPVTEIGVITEQTDIVISRGDGIDLPLTGGFDHFARR